ncbi:MAG: hypothetical protein GTO02_00900 [Candidatus Dadabacteria bacterium]|nr:hypothetical protein [Candidatus Dadabacteria bacterium]NIQ13003.1 hypothetical protein [Candidatus Dadabacteria bacterium]
MGKEKNQEINDLSSYIKNLTDQEIKILLLKLKNEIKKEDITWEQIKDILSVINLKDNKILHDVIPFLLN